MSRLQCFLPVGGAMLMITFSAMLASGFGSIRARAPSGISQAEHKQQMIRIHEVSSVKAEPDTAYLLMSVRTEKSLLAEAAQENEKQMQAFIAALKQIGIAPAALSVKNFVVEQALIGKGFSYARNLVITVEHIDKSPANEFASLVAKVQDVGARFGSSCITCIGSG
jgi:uncharacterized protein YggE